MRRAVFLDRDGTVIEDHGYLKDEHRVRLIPGAAEAIASLNGRFLVIIASNQSGVARGLLREEDVRRINAAAAEQLRSRGARIDAFYYCPHHPAAQDPRYRMRCECRKPRPGLLVRAAEQWGIDLQSSFVIGDQLRDIEAGLAAGCTPVLVLTGRGKESLAAMMWPRTSVSIAEGLEEAAQHILAAAEGR